MSEVQTAPNEPLSEFIFTPEAARAQIETLRPNDPNYGVDQILSLGHQGSSHELYALAVIASQDKPMDLNDVYHRLYPKEKKPVTDADIEAFKAARLSADSGAWEKFLESRTN